MYLIAILLGIIWHEIELYLYHTYGSHHGGIYRDGHMKHHINDNTFYKINTPWQEIARHDFEQPVQYAVIRSIIILIIGFLLFPNYKLYFIIFVITVWLAAYWSYYLHASYHIPNHWLEIFPWFRQNRKKHQLHHLNHNCNYGIFTFWMDSMMGTYSQP